MASTVTLNPFVGSISFNQATISRTLCKENLLLLSSQAAFHKRSHYSQRLTLAGTLNKIIASARESTNSPERMKTAPAQSFLKREFEMELAEKELYSEPSNLILAAGLRSCGKSAFFEEYARRMAVEKKQAVVLLNARRDYLLDSKVFLHVLLRKSISRLEFLNERIPCRSSYHITEELMRQANPLDLGVRYMRNCWREVPNCEKKGLQEECHQLSS